MRNLRSLSVLVILFALSGCLLDPYGSYTDDDGWYDPPVVDARIEQAWLGGDMDDLGTFEGDAYEATYQNYGSNATITLHAGREGGSDFGWAMIGLTTYADGGFEGDTFAPGAVLTSENGDLSALGCTGPERGNWDFDGSANEIEVRVEEGPTPNSRLFHFRAVYDQANGGVTEGSFILVDEPNPGGAVNG